MSLKMSQRSTGESYLPKDLVVQAYAQSFLASFMAIAAGLLNFLHFHDYPLLTAEVVMMLLATVSLCALASMVYIGVRQSLRVLLEIFLVGIAVDLATEGWMWAVGAMVIAFLLRLRLQEQFLSILAIFAGIVTLTTILDVGPSSGRISPSDVIRVDHAVAARDRPAIVHVILDEHLGLAGFPEDPSSQATRAALSNFYAGRGFSLMPRAYSPHLHTINAIPEQLNLGSPLDGFAGRNDASVAPKLEYFSKLGEMGYSTSIYQSDFLDLCENNIHKKCRTYRASDIRYVARSSLNHADKAILVSANFLRNSSFLGAMGQGYETLLMTSMSMGLEPDLRLFRLNTLVSWPAASMDIANKLEQDLMSAKLGDAYFLHSLIPHFPFGLKSNCELKPPSQWLHHNDLVPIQVRQNAYDEQVLCSARIIDRFLQAISQSKARSNFVMIVHGDHGSRIVRSFPRSSSQNLSEEDLIASYSTLFAVRLPDGTPAIDRSVVTVDELLRSLVASEFQAVDAQGELDPKVWLSDGDWKPQRQISLPEPF